MKWTCLQHVAFEGPAYLESWAKAGRHAIERVELWTGAPLPRPDEVDGLFILGGPMNVYEEERHPWLAPEKRFIRETIDAGKPALGICLGAQLLSVVLGGEVAPNPSKEIGWFPVEPTAAGREAGLFRDFPELFTAFHWHGDRFSTPPGAVHAARSAACEEQAFVVNDRVVGLQFHLESTRESIAALLKHGAADMVPAPTVQDASTIRAGLGRLPEAHALLDRVLDRIVHAAA